MKIQDAPNDVPSRIIYEITQLCVFNCPDCIARVEEPYLKGPSKEEMVIIGKKCVDEGVPSLSWTGGEPFLRKGFLSAIEEIVEYDSEDRVIQTVDTTGVLITSEIAKRAANLFSLARVSIYGTPDTFYQETGLSTNARFSYLDIYNGIQNFIDAGLPIQLNVPVYSLRYLDVVIEEINKRCLDHSLIRELVFIPRIIPGKSANTKYPTYEQIRAYLAWMQERFRFKIRLFEWREGKHMVIKADNLAYAHPVNTTSDGLLCLGSALELSIRELWNRFPDEFKRSHRRLTPDVSYLRK